MKNFKFAMAATLVAAFAMTSVVRADALNTRPIDPLGDNGSEDNLQEIFDNLKVGSVGGIDAVKDQIENALFRRAAGSPSASFIIELTAGALGQSFGLYNSSDSSKRATVFGGGSTDGDQAQIIFDFATGNVIVTVTDVAPVPSSTTTTFLDIFADNSTAEFGFFLTTTNGTFFTEDSLNGGDARALVYQGDNETTLDMPFIGAGLFEDAEFIFAWEDGAGLGDRDYQDMVILVESIVAVPVPGALLLGAMGMGMIGWVRKRVK